MCDRESVKERKNSAEFASENCCLKFLFLYQISVDDLKCSTSRFVFSFSGTCERILKDRVLAQNHSLKQLKLAGVGKSAMKLAVQV